MALGFSPSAGLWVCDELYQALEAKATPLSPVNPPESLRKTTLYRPCILDCLRHSYQTYIALHYLQALKLPGASSWVSPDSKSEIRCSWLVTVDYIPDNFVSMAASLFSNLTASESSLVSRSALSCASLLANVAPSIAESAVVVCSGFLDSLLGLDDILWGKLYSQCC